MSRSFGSKTFLIVLLLMTVGCITASPPKTAAPKIESSIGQQAPSGSDVIRVANALEMGFQAEEKRDADKLILAANQLGSLGAMPDDDLGENLAKRWASDARTIDPTIVEPIYRGRVLGPAYREGRIAALDSIEVEQLFLAGKRASVAIVPAKGSSIAISIRNGKGKAVCNRPLVSSKTSCQWVPTFTTRHQINIQNKSRKASSYFLVVD